MSAVESEDYNLNGGNVHGEYILTKKSATLPKDVNTLLIFSFCKAHS